MIFCCASLCVLLYGGRSSCQEPNCEVCIPPTPIYTEPLQKKKAFFFPLLVIDIAQSSAGPFLCEFQRPANKGERGEVLDLSQPAKQFAVKVCRSAFAAGVRWQ